MSKNKPNIKKSEYLPDKYKDTYEEDYQRYARKKTEENISKIKDITKNMSTDEVLSKLRFD